MTPPHYSTKYVWYVVALLAVVNVFNYMDRMALAVLLPSIKADLQLSDSQLGLLVGLAFALFYAICGVPIARLADRGVRRNIIAISLATWSVMTALCGVAHNFWQLLLARVGVGAAEAGCLPPAQSLLCDYVPLEQRSGAFAIHGFGVTVGMMLGMALAGWLGETIGWRWAFVVLGLPGIAFAVVVRLTLREPPRGILDTVKDDQSDLSLLRTLQVLWDCRTYRLLMVVLVVNGFVHYGLNQWWPSFYTRVFDLGSSAVGLYLGVAIGAGSGIGLLVGGLLANRVARRDVRLPLLIGAAATALAFPAALASILIRSGWGSLLLVAVTGFCWSVASAPAVAGVYSVVRPRMRATAGAITILFTSVLGFGLGPFSVGLLSDLLTPMFGVEALRYALLMPVALLPVTVLALCLAAQRLPQDLRAAVAKT